MAQNKKDFNSTIVLSGNSDSDNGDDVIILESKVCLLLRIFYKNYKIFHKIYFLVTQ